MPTILQVTMQNYSFILALFYDRFYLYLALFYARALVFGAKFKQYKPRGARNYRT